MYREYRLCAACGHAVGGITGTSGTTALARAVGTGYKTANGSERSARRRGCRGLGRVARITQGCAAGRRNDVWRKLRAAE